MKATSTYQITERPKPTDWRANVKPGDILVANDRDKLAGSLWRRSMVIATKYEDFNRAFLFKVDTPITGQEWIRAERFLEPAMAKPNETEKPHLKALAPDSLLDQAIEAAERAHQALMALAKQEWERTSRSPTSVALSREEDRLSMLVWGLKTMKQPPNTSDARAREGKTPDECRLGGKTTTFGGSAGILPDHLG